MAHRSVSGRPRRRKKAGAPVGLILSLVFSGIGLLVAVVGVVVIASQAEENSPNPDGQVEGTDQTPTGQPAETGLFGIVKTPAALPGPDPEPKPFFDQGDFKVGPLQEKEVQITKCECLETWNEDGLTYSRWRLDYEFVNGGFRRVIVGQPGVTISYEDPNAYFLNVRASTLNQFGDIVNQAWLLNFPANRERAMREPITENRLNMMEPKGTFEVTIRFLPNEHVHPIVFWFECKDRKRNLFSHIRVSNFATDPTPNQ